MNRCSVLVLVLAVAGCGGAGGDGDASPMDDAGDSGSLDAGPTDAGSPDGGPADSEPADSGEPDAGPEPCTTEAEMRAVSCGACGLAQEVCEAGFWVRGACMAEGACAPGAVEAEELPDCTSRSRICTGTCEWTDWDATGEAGECEVDARRFVDDVCGLATRQEQVCSPVCVWEDVGACTSACGSLRATPPDAAEVCVPGGDFVRGSDMFPSTSPVARVHVSTFALGKFPVTVRRFLECRAAGRCSVSLPDTAEARLLDPGLLDHPVLGADYAQAQEFCSWDGDRRLPTEAEFEKGVRGPAPRENVFPWDGDAYRCDLLPTRGCPGVPDILPLTDPVTAFPGARSFYGAEGMFGSGYERVSDWWDPDYYSDPTSLSDPAGPDSAVPGAGRGSRGSPRIEAMLRRIYERRSGSSFGGGPFRCVRDVPEAP